MPETIVFSAFQTTVLLNMLQKKRNRTTELYQILLFYRIITFLWKQISLKNPESPLK
jgi:hypothetical protein